MKKARKPVGRVKKSSWKHVWLKGDEKDPKVVNPVDRLPFVEPDAIIRDIDKDTDMLFI